MAGCSHTVSGRSPVLIRRAAGGPIHRRTFLHLYAGSPVQAKDIHVATILEVHLRGGLETAQRRVLAHREDCGSEKEAHLPHHQLIGYIIAPCKTNQIHPDHCRR